MPRICAQEFLADIDATEYDRVHAILSSTSVLDSLGITLAQREALRAVDAIEWKEIPSVSNLLACTSKSADSLTRYYLLREAEHTASEFKLSRIASVLHADQWRALQSILWRLEGLSVVIHNADIRAKLGVTADQLAQMKLAASRYAPLLASLEQRLGRQMIAGLRPDEDMSERKQEVECIARVIDALRADRDQDIRAILTEDQRRKWDVLVTEGVPPGLYAIVTNLPIPRSSALVPADGKDCAN